MHKVKRIVTAATAALCATLAAAALMAARTPPQTHDLKGEVIDEKGVPIPIADCTLTGIDQVAVPEQGVSLKTDDKGQFSFPNLLPGTYALTCAAVGYQPIYRGGIEVTAEQAPFVQVVLPAEIILRQTVEVREKAPAVAQQEAAPPANISAPQLESLPLVEQKFQAALPLVPGVVRTPDGKLSIKGTNESQGVLLVGAAEAVDPVTGSYSVQVPVDAVESVRVFKSAYNAQYGRFSGGLTLVDTKSPPSEWKYELNDLLPTPRFRSGHLVGLMDDGPRLSFGGPILHNKLTFSEALTYLISKQPVRGLRWPQNETKTESYNSFTSLQYIFSPQHLLTVNVNAYPVKKEFVDINSLLPQSASSNYGQKGYSFEAVDRLLTDSGAVLTTLFQDTKFDSNGYGQGPLDMLITPDGRGGNFFNKFVRHSNQQEVLQTFQFPKREWHGKHEIKIGGDFEHRDYDGTSLSHRVQLRRTDGTLAEQIDFSGPASLAADDFELGVFFQDHWVFNDQLAMDMGVRASGQTLGQPVSVAPRYGFVYSPGAGGKTIVRGGAGFFYDRVPLLATDFTDNPDRTVSFFDPAGQLVAGPIVYRNRYLRYKEGGQGITPSRNRLDSTPYNFTWNLEADQELRPHMILRLSYLSSRTYDVFVINPLIDPTNPDRGVMLLSNTGATRYHEFESTFRYRPSEKADINVSYVYSLSRGDLNSLNSIYVPFEQPVIRPDAFSSLPSNIPSRIITWAQFKLPWGVTAAPLYEIHSGFPYSAVDVNQNYVGAPNSLRFPSFMSLDLKAGRDFTIKFLPWVRNHKLRGAFAVYNLTDHANPRDVFNSIASSNFGHFVGFQHRSWESWLDIVY